MAYKLLKFLSIERDVNRETGEQRVYANFQELQPERKRVNLSKADAGLLQAFEALQGKTVMLSAEDRFFKGDDGIFSYLALQKGDGALPVIFEAPAHLSKPASTDTGKSKMFS
jgi:hypothetical protein